MSPHTSPGTSDDLFERIAQLLDPHQRAYFYERMVYFRHLRPDDELLRLVEAIGFLAVIIRAAPEALAAERAQMADTLATSLATLQGVAETSAAYHRDLEARLSGLPAEVAEGIRPSAIAHAIAEHLRQQVAQTGLPVTAGALALTTRELTALLTVVQQTVKSLGPWTHAAADAREAVEHVLTAVAQMAAEAQHTLTRLQAQFTADYRHALTLLCGAALVLGGLLGVEVQRWREARAAAPPPIAVSSVSAAPEPPAAALPTSPAHRRALTAPATRPADGLHGPFVDHPWNDDGTASHAAAPTP